MLIFWKIGRLSLDHIGSHSRTCSKLQKDSRTNILSVDRGGFGQVYKGILPTSKTEVAVKRVSHESRQGMREFIAEVVSIGRLRHRNIVQLLGYCRRKRELILVYEYMPNGSLDNYLYTTSDDRPCVGWHERFQIIKGIASGLARKISNHQRYSISRHQAFSTFMNPGNKLSSIETLRQATMCSSTEI